MNDKVSLWTRPATIERNNFKFKSLSCWSYNIAVGCEHGCRFCYVPEVSTIKMAAKLREEYGVQDPDAEWGDYLMLRKWDRHAFMSSLKLAEKTNASDLNADGNRAVMFCTTTDPYQVIRHVDADRRRILMLSASQLVREALELILENSSLNVRILTRSPLARRDFDIFKRFGSRLLFGMSLPTLNSRLAKVYEPKAPAPERRLETLQLAREQGLNVFVAVAPTYPECDYDDIRATFAEIAPLNPVTVFHENINIRADNVRRIHDACIANGIEPKTDVFLTRKTWAAYAHHQLMQAALAANETGLIDRLHLWPDAALGALNPQHLHEYERWWSRVSEWPK